MEGLADQLGNASRVLDLHHPFGQLAEHAAVIDFLERLAVGGFNALPVHSPGSWASNPGSRYATADREAFQEIDYRRMFGQLAKWVVQIEDARRIPELISQALPSWR